jgi:hypothetical protein
LKENTLTSKFKIWEKHELGFHWGLGALEKETPSKKKLEGGKGRELNKFRSLDQRCMTRKMFPFNPKEKQNLASLLKVPMTSIRTIPTEVDNMITNIHEFHSPQ